MKPRNYSVLLLSVVLVLALFFRTFNISVNPPAISWDEASIGYNAYTILTTGRDEHGKFLPLDTFAAFGDYKPPLPIYLTVPFVAVLGLTELAVRLPSALFGVATVGMLYLLVCELFHRAKERKMIGVWAAFLMAITPWHIMLSRAGFEANIALFFLITGVWLVLRGRSNQRYFYVAWVPFVMGIYTFNSTRYAAPLIAGALFLIVRKDLFRARKQAILGILVACMLLLPIAPHLVSKQARLRFEEVSIFTDLRTVLTSNTRREADNFSLLSSLLHNRRVGYAREYFIHFFDNLEPRFLFIRGDGNPKFSVQDVGQLLMVGAPFLAFGWLTLFRDYRMIGGLLLWWLISAIIPTAVARETPHALRIENGLPVYMIVTAYGIVQAIGAVRGKWKAGAGMLLILFFLGNFGYFWHTLMAHYPKEFSGEWQYGYKSAIAVAEKYQKDFDTVVLTESIGRPYIYALFYNRTSLAEFSETKDASFDAAGFYNVYGFGKYRFVKEKTGNFSGKVLYIMPPKDVPATARVIETVRLLNGTPVLVAFE